ncbi:MAG TPA: Hint domain-containing protein [Acetobacteraceae bacterium]|nr:Hint domain-containing protein [Acetobacteraceae bacterium]
MSGSPGPETFQSTVFAPGNWARGGIDDLGVYTGGTAGTTTAVLTGVLTRPGDVATATIDGQTIALRAYSDLANGVLFTTPDFSTFYAFTMTPFSPAQPYPLSYTVAGLSELACFLAGTRIATPRGEVAVERLRRGMVVSTAFQGSAVVRWVGQRRIAPAGPRAWPVRIAAHAIAAGRPRRDLFLSPDHAVFLDGALIPAHALVNGASITRHSVACATYVHVELAVHDLLLAEGLPAESYLDTGNRRAFDRPAASPGARRSWRRDACASLLLARADQAPMRARLIARAAALGHRLTDDPALTLVADGRKLPVQRQGDRWRAMLPPGTGRLHVCSRSAVPAEIHPHANDPRRLGLAVTHLALDGAVIPPGDPRRAAGWHRPEPDLQWTDGEALLLCGAADRPRLAEIAAPPLLRYWQRGDHGVARNLDVGVIPTQC